VSGHAEWVVHGLFGYLPMPSASAVSSSGR
jgi:hypothetical protein